MMDRMNAVAPVPTRRMMAGPTGMPALDQVRLLNIYNVYIMYIYINVYIITYLLT